jgi:hypothetical protein
MIIFFVLLTVFGLSFNAGINQIDLFELRHPAKKNAYSGLKIYMRVRRGFCAQGVDAITKWVTIFNC